MCSRSRIDRLSATEPLFIDIVSVGGFEDIRRGLRLCRYAKKVDGLSSMLHIACADVSIDEMSALLEEAKAMGVDNLLLERGVPSSTASTVRPPFVAHREGFTHVRELIAHIRKRYGSYFCLGVMGYPSGLGEYGSPEEEMKELKLKCDAGANFVVTQHVNDARAFTEFRDRALAEGVSLPMIPSLMPVLSYSSFVQVNSYCGVPIPAAFLAGLHSLQEDDKAVREYGNRHVVQLAKDLMAAGASVLHFHTMNLEVVIRNVLQDVGLCGPGAGTRRKLPWRPSGDDYRASEDVRPIFWANRPESYLERTAGWLNFPSGMGQS
jgi:methylenetetrahydrofolate reductase (NADPH)